MKALFTRLVLAFCYLMLSLQVIAATEFKIITLQHRFAEDILPTIRPLVGSEGAATGIQNQLIIRASPENMAEIEQIIANFDVERKNIRITVRHQSNLQNESDGVTVNGRKRFGNVEIGSNKYPRSTMEGVQIGIENSQNSSNTNGNQFVNVIDGEQAFIRVGQSVPFTQEWVTLTHRYAHVQQTTEFLDVTTGFAVRPRSIGDQIELEITPRIAKLNQNGFIDFEELSTIVRINRGEWFDLAGTMQQKDDVSRAILSKQSSNQSQSNQLSIRVE